MNFLYWIIVGAIAGAIGKAIMPGASKEPGGWIMTIILGIVGAVVGGWAGGLLGLSTGGSFIGTLVTAVVGAVIVIAALRLLSGRKIA